MSKKNSKPVRTLPSFDKYDLYRRAVQSPAADVEHFAATYKELRGKNAQTLREDFCGTFGIACEWVKLDSRHHAIGVDLDPEPIQYGMANYYPKLSDKEKKRIEIINGNVMSAKAGLADLTVAVNFSYYLFKSRLLLRNYFKRAYAGLEKDGIFMVDSFGGPLCQEPNEEEKVFKTFSYFWDQDKYDPISNEALFYIHFKRKGEKKREKVFTYDWRMWTIPEIRELMIEAGFSETVVYWEGTTKDGEGNGEYTRVTTAEDCGAWVAYIVGLK